MTRPDLLLTAPFPPAMIAPLDAAFTLHRLWEQPDADAFLAAAGPRIRAIATSALAGRVDGALLDRLPAVEIVANFGVGYDNVDAALAAARGVVVTNTPGVLDDEVADFTVGLLIATLRQIPQADRYLRDGRWREANFPLTPSLRGRRIGIVGLGNIGRAVARRLAAFDLPIAYHGRTRQGDQPYAYHPTLVGLAEAVDVLIAIVPGGPGTRHLIGAPVFDALGPDGVFVNVARGSVVDEAALVDALRTGRILTAGLDVYEDEPAVPEALVAMEHVVLLPHVGSGSIPTRAAMGQLVVDNLLAWFATGEPVTPVPESRALVAG